MATGALPDLGKLEAALLNVNGDSKLDARFRTLFTLKGLGSMSDDRRERVIEIISKGFADDSALLKHELAYVLGQLQDARALEKLNKVLSDEQEHAMVRHEAAEAMGAISSPQSLPILKKYLEDPDVSIRETCHLAIHKIELENSDAGRKEAELKRQRESTHEDAIAAAARATAPIDPAPALVQGARGNEGADVNVYTLENVPYFREVLLDTSRTLFDRYRAMFALRDTVKYGSPEAKEPSVQALASALKDNSALFRHEICFVFGELCHPSSAAAMTAVLNDEAEHEMVRHEAAEALGGVLEEADEAGEELSTYDKVVQALQRWAHDDAAPRVVRESCVVALDEIAYNNDPTQFHRVEA